MRSLRTMYTVSIRFALAVIAISIFLLGAISAFAKPGDTARVKVFDQYLWTYYGSQNRWGIFPGKDHRYEKILMHYHLKCPTGTCGQWDYTTNVFLERHTGKIDSSIQKAPSFTVDGGTKDSLPFRRDTTRTYTYNSKTKLTDSAANKPVKVIFFRDPAHPFNATDSTNVWPAGYYNRRYNAAGAVTDSFYVKGDSVLHLSYRDTYVPFEVLEEFEMGRLITPYGQWFPQGQEFIWTFDVTDYAYLLHDSVDIRSFYDGYSQGSLFTLDFEMVEGTPAKDVFRIENLYDGYFAYGNPNDPIENHLPPKTVTIDPASTSTSLKITTTGHGFGGTENAAEFSNKTHSVDVNGTQRFTQHLWRDDCGQNPVYPQAGTWYFQRGGWCPGSDVRPNVYDLTPFVTPGKPAVIDYNMEPFVNDDLSHGATYIVHAQVMYATGPNFQNDATIDEIRTPSQEFRYRRMNPICSDANPLIVIRNTGAKTLTDLTINYGVSGGASGSYKWKGNLPFMETAEVSLPGIDLGTGDGRFTATVENPNGVADEYPSNNAMTSTYTVPHTYSSTVYLTLKTDDVPAIGGTTNGIAYEVRALDGTVLYQRDGFDDNKLIRDTFKLADGCYQFVITDLQIGDGLYPIYQGSTPGYYLLKDNRNQTIANANSTNHLANFGDREIIPFSVSSTLSSVDEGSAGADNAFAVFPNPTTGELTVDLPASSVAAGKQASLRVMTLLGTEVTAMVLQGGARSMNVDLGGQPSGVYIVQYIAGEKLLSRRVLLMRP
ncbi:MAG: peptide-N-glycosidase F-related protein [Candidatus Kapaibacterium sp.]